MMRPGPQPKDVATRFASKVEPCLITGCWLWVDAPDSDGYGRLLVGGKVTKAHRVSYELHNGPIPPGLNVLHRCDTPACVNPAHLWLGTQPDNIADMVAKGRCRAAGPINPKRGAAHVRAKLSEEVVLTLRARAARGEHVNRSHEARRYGVSVSTLSRALRGLTWDQVPGPPKLDLFGEGRP